MPAAAATGPVADTTTAPLDAAAAALAATKDNTRFGAVSSRRVELNAKSRR
jgi:hypothetical protein